MEAFELEAVMDVDSFTTWTEAIEAAQDNLPRIQAMDLDEEVDMILELVEIWDDNIRNTQAFKTLRALVADFIQNERKGEYYDLRGFSPVIRGLFIPLDKDLPLNLVADALSRPHLS
ncbi:MAG: hypothetical protein AAF808_06810 [Cyanobacteria bacterium P01_D01_bin.2]